MYLGKMAIRIKMVTKTNNKLEKAIQTLKSGYVKIGWFEGQKEPNGLLVSENAYMQNNGFTIKHKNGKQTYVPPRPFMQITMTNNANKWNNFWKQHYKEVVDGKINLKQALNRLGIMVKSDIQDTIISSNGIRPNAPSTIESKRRKGSPLIPLIDSSTMLSSINYKSEEQK